MELTETAFKRILLISNDKPPAGDAGLVPDYEISVTNIKKVREELSKHPIPELIIFILRQLSGMEINLVKDLKSNPLTAHLPVAGVIDRLTDAIHIEGIRAGMDLVFPGSVDRKVLQVSLTGLMSERARLKEIYQLSDVPKSNGGEVTFDQFFLQRARKIVLNNYTNSDFNIEQFVKNMNVSRTMLYVKIKQLTGYTTSEFVRGIRMEEAARLLKEGMLNVSEVAFKVGFKDPKYLSKKFKLCYGITPSDFRRGGLKSI